MNAERYAKIRSVFAAASDLGVEERGTFLDRECAGDPELRHAVETLLDEHEHDEAPHAADRAVADAVSRLVADVPVDIGGYSVRRLIGSGGMGAVYEARQANPERAVALKIINPGVMTPGLAARFRNEARILARLRHAGIAQIYDAGTFEQGGQPRPFFAMELVEGVEITRWADDHDLSVRDRLLLLAGVCDAVHHAHQRGVIHRDLKPGNILIDAAAQPKILDFGVARLIDTDTDATGVRTQVGELIGTLPYMSPEQLRGDAADLDIRVDVYALGVLGYRLLGGRLPHDLSRASVPEAARIIEERDPPRLGSIDRGLRGDVETIISKACAKDRERRYASAADLAADIRRSLADQAIEARPASTVYQLRKFAKRNRALVGGAAATIVTLAGGLAATIVFATGEARERARAVARADELELVTAFQSSVLQGLDAAGMGRDMTAALREAVREDLVAGGADETRIAAELSRFDAFASGWNQTSIALELLDRHLLARTAEAIDSQFTDRPSTETALRQNLADLSRRLGLLERAYEQQSRVTDARISHFGAGSPRSLESINALGLTLQAMGRLDEAEARYRAALAGRRRALGERHPDTLATRNNLGSLLRVLGRHAEALEQYRAALDGRRLVLGDDHPDTLTSVNNMALLLKSRGDLDEASHLYRQAVQTARGSLGPDDPLTLSLIANTAACLEAMGRRDEALPLYSEALEGRRRALGDDHPDTLTSINNMGHVLQRLERHETALGYCREAYDRRVALLGADHPSSITSLNNLAACLRSLGRYDEAIPLQREAVERAQRVRGRDHPAFIVLLSNLAGVLRESGLHGEALECSARAVALAEQAFPARHWRRGVLLLEHGKCLTANSEPQRAIDTLNLACQMLTETLGREDSRTLAAAEALDDLLRTRPKP